MSTEQVSSSYIEYLSVLPEGDFNTLFGYTVYISNF